MKGLVLAGCLLIPMACWGGKKDDSSGAHAFKNATVECLVAGMRAGVSDAETLAKQCVKAVEIIWETAYGPRYLPVPKSGN